MAARAAAPCFAIPAVPSVHGYGVLLFRCWFNAQRTRRCRSGSLLNRSQQLHNPTASPALCQIGKWASHPAAQPAAVANADWTPSPLPRTGRLTRTTIIAPLGERERQRVTGTGAGLGTASPPASLQGKPFHITHRNLQRWRLLRSRTLLRIHLLPRWHPRSKVLGLFTFSAR